jgi:hypothetical protein
LQYDSGIEDENRIVIFCADENLIHLEKSKVICMDGTFKSCINGFLQLYTLVTNLKGKNIPLMFVLMATKNEKGYLKICDYIMTKVPRLNPMAVILDFEKAFRKAFHKKNS